MSVEVVSKKKNGLVCKSCDHALSDEEIEKRACAECGSEELKKSLVIVRKAVGDEDDDLETAALDADVEDSDEEDEDDSEEEEEESEDEEDESDDEDEDENEEEEVEDEAPVTKSISKLRNVEVLNIMTACAEDVTKALESGEESEYEEVMVELNNVLDTAVKKWFEGKTITKQADAKGHAELIRDRVNGILGKEKVVSKKNDKKNLSTITKRSDLPEDVQKSLKQADEIVEKAAQKEWDDIAKSYKHFPGDKSKLAKTLRTLNAADPEAYKELKKNLDSAEEALETSDIFKSYGGRGGDESPDESGVDQSEVKKIAKAEGITEEQARVRLMDGKAYQPTA